MSTGLPDSGVGEEQLRAAAEDIRQAVRRGESDAIEAVLDEDSELLRDPEQALDLIYCELNEREQQGQRPDCDEYCRRFPQWADRIRRLFDVHEAFRSTGASGPGPAGFASEFPTAWSVSNSSAPRPDDGPRHRCVGQYELMAEIGSGATGVVFKARQTRLNRFVAVKVLRPFGTDEARERFIAEAELTARLKHPHIVQLHEVGQDAGVDFMSMELLEGGSLATHLGRTVFTPRDAAELLCTLSAAIAEAHAEGIVHRDLKPGNVLLAPDGTPRISDFGLARHLADSGRRQTRTGAILGTPGYMAPEQAVGSADAGPAADIYSLGAILYELLTGRPPYHGTSVVEILGQMRAVDPAPVRQLRPSVPRDLNTICMKCLERSPEQRYRTATDLRDELTRFLEGRPITARPVSAAEKVWRWSARNRSTAGLTCVLLLAVVAAAVGITWQWFRAEDNLTRAQAARIRAQGAERQEQQQRVLAEDRLYRRQILAANRELLVAATTSGSRLLDECDPGRRGWEWEYLSAQARSTDQGFAGHTTAITALEISPDGRWAAGCGGNYARPEGRTTIVWRVDTGEEVWRFSRSGQGLCLAFSPDSRQLLIAGCGQATLHEAETGAVLRSFESDNRVSHWGAAISPDGDLAAVPSLFSLRLWNLGGDGTGFIECDATPGSGGVHAAAFNPDASRIAVATRRQGLKLFDTKSGTLLDTLEFAGDLRVVRFSSDGRRLAASGYSLRSQGLLRIWKVSETGYELLHTRYDRSGVRTAFRFTPDNQCLATWSGTSPVRLLDLVDLHESAAYSAHQYTTHVAFGPDSRFMLTAGEDGTVRAWDRSPEIRISLSRRDPAYVTDLAIHPESELVALAGDKNPFRGARSYTNSVEVMNLNQWRRVHTLRGHKAAVTCLDYDASGQWLATGSDDLSVRLWDAHTGEALCTNSTHRAPVVGVHFAAQGEPRIVSVDRGGVVVVHAGPELQVTAQYETGLPGVTHTCLRGGRLCAVTSRGRAVMLSVTDGGTQVVGSFGGPLNCVAISPQGNQICLAGDDGRVRLLQLSGTGRANEIWARTVHRGSVHSVAFHPSGDRIVTTGADGYIRILEAGDGQELLPLKTATYPGPVYRAKFDATTNRLVAGTRARIYAWETQRQSAIGLPQNVTGISDWHRALAWRCEASENWLGAAGHWRRVGELDDVDGWCHIYAAKCCVELEDWSAAESAFRTAVRVAEARTAESGADSFAGQACYELAKFLATCPDKSYRSGREAMQFAARALAESPRNRDYLGAMTSALAEVARTRSTP